MTKYGIADQGWITSGKVFLDTSLPERPESHNDDSTRIRTGFTMIQSIFFAINICMYPEPTPTQESKQPVESPDERKEQKDQDF